MTDRMHPNMLHSRRAMIEGVLGVFGVAALADLAMTRVTAAEAQGSATQHKMTERRVAQLPASS